MYGTGTEPDPRFSLANERTFLAWIRTSLALLAGGVALDTVDLDGPGWLKSTLAVGLVLCGLGFAAGARLRWAGVERAMRRGQPLPATMLTTWFSLVLVLVAGALAFLLV